MHDGQNPRLLHANGTRSASPHLRHRALALADERLKPSDRGNVPLSAAWIKQANGAPPPEVQALARAAREQLGDDPGPGPTRELTALLES